MLSGEYAVLYGATAALVPVPRRITLSSLEDPEPGSSLDALPPAARAAAMLPVKRLEEYEALRPLRGFAIDDSEFFAEGAAGQRAKLGLGLSAAEAVGVVALRYEHAGLNWQAHEVEVMRSALVAHRMAQGGGSGAVLDSCAL
jgi:mevalonate kinase